MKLNIYTLKTLTVHDSEGLISDFHFGINFSLPVYQNVDEPQMLNEGILTFGLQYTIH